jgi:hypothetical protein
VKEGQQEEGRGDHEQDQDECVLSSSLCALELILAFSVAQAVQARRTGLGTSRGL